MATLQLLTTAEAAKLLAVAPGTLRNWRCAGTGPTYIDLGGGTIRYRLADIEAWLEPMVVPAC